MATKVTIVNNGPIRIEGEFTIQDSEGNSYGLGGRSLFLFAAVVSPRINLSATVRTDGMDLILNAKRAICLRRNQSCECIRHRPKKSPRLIELDILRGFLLLWMTLTHLPTKASMISNQTFGFVSGAEGFIFLAAFMVGQLEFRREQTRGEVATVQDLAKRTFRVYVYHCGLLLIAFTVFAKIAVSFHRPAVQNLLSYYLHSPGQAVLAALLLQYRPSLLDILPLYIIFMGATPIARKIAQKWGWDPVVYASFLLWVAAQCGLRSYVFHHFTPFGIPVPENSTGAFDVYAWQLLWLCGLALGTINADHLAGVAVRHEPAADEGMPKWLIRLSVAIASVFLVLRYSPVERWIDPHLSWMADRQVESGSGAVSSIFPPSRFFWFASEPTSQSFEYLRRSPHSVKPR